MTSAVLTTVTAPGGHRYDDALADVVGRARGGDAEALAYVFDHVFYDVYHEVFLATHDRRQAERATRKALDRLPAMLRSRRYETPADLRAALVAYAGRTLQPARRTKPSDGNMRDLRAGLRHLVVVGAASVAAAGALILAV